MSLIHGRPEFVLSHRFDCLFIQSHPQVTRHMDVFRIALCVHDQGDRHNALIPGPARRVGKVRLNGMNHAWCDHSAAHAHHASAIAADCSRSDAGAIPCSDSTTTALAKARTTTAAF